jgi:hypothetical protein
MNHYETFHFKPVLSDVQETVSKFEDFLTTRGPNGIRRLGP